MTQRQIRSIFFSNLCRSTIKNEAHKMLKNTYVYFAAFDCLPLSLPVSDACLGMSGSLDRLFAVLKVKQLPYFGVEYVYQKLGIHYKNLYCPLLPTIILVSQYLEWFTGICKCIFTGHQYNRFLCTCKSKESRILFQRLKSLDQEGWKILLIMIMFFRIVEMFAWRSCNANKILISILLSFKNWAKKVQYSCKNMMLTKKTQK